MQYPPEGAEVKQLLSSQLPTIGKKLNASWFEEGRNNATMVITGKLEFLKLTKDGVLAHDGVHWYMIRVAEFKPHEPQLRVVHKKTHHIHDKKIIRK